MIKHFIFDYDGLMVNSEQVVFEALESLFKKYGKKLTWEYYCRHIGRSIKDSMKSFHKDHALKLDLEAFTRARNRIVKEYIDKKIRLMPGLLSLLLLLKKRSIAMSIATSGRRNYIANGLNKFEIGSYFTLVTCIDDVQRGKPHPDLIERTLELSGYTPKETLILEDSPYGIEAAHRAGVYSIAIPTQGVPYEQFQKASMIVSDLHFLHKVLSTSNFKPQELGAQVK